jgi:hypothetical protein
MTKEHRATEAEMEGPVSFWESRNRKRLIVHEHDDDDDDEEEEDDNDDSL